MRYLKILLDSSSKNNLRNNSRIIDKKKKIRVIEMLAISGEFEMESFRNLLEDFTPSSAGLEVFVSFESLLLTRNVTFNHFKDPCDIDNVISYVFNNEFNDLVESLITQEILLKIFNELVAFNIRIICSL